MVAVQYTVDLATSAFATKTLCVGYVFKSS